MKEIKASDLRIGNMIFFDDPVDGELINKIDWHDLKWISEDYETFNEFHRPIQLTEEWIDKLSDEEYAFEGFGSRIIYKCIKFPVIKYEFSSNCVLVYFQAELINIVDYVHQWQNIHHALTREELTINN